METTSLPDQVPEQADPLPRRRGGGGVVLKTVLGGALGLLGVGTGYNMYQGEVDRTERQALQGTVEGQRQKIEDLLRDQAKSEEGQRVLKELVKKFEGELTTSELVELIEKTRCSLVAVGPIDNPASGFFINDCEFIVTNHHVAEVLTKWGHAKDGQFPISLYQKNRSEEPFTFFATMEKVGGKGQALEDASSAFQGGSDLVVLRVPEQVRKQLPKWVRSVEFRDVAKDPIKGGELALVCGNPRGLLASINVGKVSHGERHLAVGQNPLFPVVQVDAEMNSGNSGGLTVDSKGRLMGVSYYGHGPGLNHARHVLNLKAELEKWGIVVSISAGERDILARWQVELDAMKKQKKPEPEHMPTVVD